MIRFFRYGMAALLVALLTLTGLSLASERGVARIAGQIILCTGHGPVAVWVDAEGQPVDKTALCPDQTLSLLGAIALPEPVVQFRPVVAEFGVTRIGRAFSEAAAIEPRGRSPPHSV